METAEIRRRFVAHFERHGHTVVPSASLLLDDPNLLFVNAGMVPFKPYFLGQETPQWDRATSVQKCVRTLDIEEVGKTTRHGTFFQMCGNFSFGDYFKEGAIRFAWELVTGSQDDGGYGFDPEKIWVTVLPSDTEAKQLWHDIAGLPYERIQERGLEDNYWNMGVPGPGGPCSEIYIDRGPEYGPDGGPNADEDRFLEIWNLVFMQESLSTVRSKADFDVEGPLPAKNIDTGMGLERVAYLLQGKDNLYEIDEVFPVIEKAAELTGRTYGENAEDDVRFRVVADHVRSALMLINDGVTPGNEARGYVLRRLLRRAVRSMRLLGYDGHALRELMPVSRDRMKKSYPEVETGWERISRVAYAEEETFRKTLEAGTQIFDNAVASVKESGGSVLAGAQAFALHDTYGFPIDLTLEMASEAGLSVDEAGFRSLMAEQRERAKADAKCKKGQHADTGVYRGILDEHGPTDWLAYETLETESRALALLVGGAPATSLAQGEVGELVLDRTPFYAESGGQAADAGIIEVDGARLEVLDVQRPVRGLVVHQVRVVDGELVLGSGSALHAQVDPEWRLGARQAHSGTHVVHAALREVLGPSALQSGSYNRPGYLRLDFGWTTAARRPPRLLGLHDPARGQGLGRHRAVRRDLRRVQGPRRGDRRPLVARALRWHPRRPLLADRHRRGHRRGVGRLGQPAHRGLHRCRGLLLPRPRARRGEPAHRPAQDPARRPRGSRRRPGRASQGRREGDRARARRPAARRGRSGGGVGDEGRTRQRGGPPGRRRGRRRRPDARDRRTRPASAGRARCRRGDRRGRRQGRRRCRGQRPGPGARRLRRRPGARGDPAARRQGRRQGRRRAGRRHRRLARRRGAGPGEHRGRSRGRGLMRHGTRLGIDPGDARIGVARSDPSGFLATPVETVRRGKGDLARLRRIVAELEEETAVLEVVVGLPRSLGGGEGPAAAKVRDFATQLAERVPVPVRLVDERLSTVSAEAMLRDQGRKGSKRRAVVDQAAAVVILQHALDTERASGNPPGEILERQS